MDYLKATVIAVLLFALLDHSDAGGNCTVVRKCDDCLKYNESKCFWCQSTKECKEKNNIFPTGCKSLNWRYYGYCEVPGYVWVVVIPLLIVLVLVSLTVCFYCCCCRCKPTARSTNKEETKFHRTRMELKAKHDERRAERKVKNDDIRKKYGLYKEDGASSSSRYEEFQNDPAVV